MKTVLLFALLVTLATAPQITTQPTGGVFQRPYKISVVATGSVPLVYQWQWSGSTLGPWHDSVDGNAAELLFPDPLPPGNYYRCVVTNAAGVAISSAVPVQITL